MYKNYKVLGVIPARSGSKGLKDKNIKTLNGKPLVAYTIEAAKKSGVFDCVMVSTDSKKYAKIAEEFGAEVPFLRSEYASGDKASTMSVIEEVIDNYKKELNKTFDVVIILQPTSPLRTAKNIKEAMDLFAEKNADTVISVCETEHSPYWCNVLAEDQKATNFIKKKYLKPRQELPKTYTLNGAVYIIKTSDIKKVNFYGKNSYIYVMDRINSVDIDSELDFLYAKSIIDSKLLK